MERVEQEYIGDGKNEMDKVYRERLTEYSRDNQSLLVESSFSGAMTIQQIIKQYLSEQKAKIELDGFTKKSYDKSGNMAVAASTKEGGK